MRAKLKGTWRGPEVWRVGRGGHQASGQERFQALGPKSRKIPGNVTVGWFSTQVLSWPRQMPTRELKAKSSPVCQQPDSRPTLSGPRLCSPYHHVRQPSRIGTAQKRLF